MHRGALKYSRCVEELDNRTSGWVGFGHACLVQSEGDSSGPRQEGLPLHTDVIDRAGEFHSGSVDLFSLRREGGEGEGEKRGEGGEVRREKRGTKKGESF